ncbi:MAG: flavodoxin family protein [Candidatus Altiarchaeota archaeon]|nr:flavodoxin family protein [Candidatus Altiarchaeota archaeon]
MKILALVGSPRKGGNTDLLVDEMLKGCKKKGHTTEKICLYDYNILPCTDCRACNSGSYKCILKDDMQRLYPQLESADVIVFGTPMYWYGPTGKMKLAMDRLLPFITSGGLKGKRGVVVIPSEEGPDACGPMLEMFKMSFSYLGMEYAGEVLAEAYEKGKVKEDKRKEANDLGASL